MDALIYTVMSGAERALQAQQVRANNLANVDTPGFRANLELATAQAVAGYGYDSRHQSMIQSDMLLTRPGALRQTGRELDVAISGDGYFTVATGAGEAYTRAGAIEIDGNGALSISGRPVMGQGGPIVLPPHSAVSVAPNGEVSIQVPGVNEFQVVGQLKLVRAEGAGLAKNEAGLIVSRDGQELQADATVNVKSGYLEGSNVSAVAEMVATMALNRDFELQMKLYRAADSMTEAGNRLIRE